MFYHYTGSSAVPALVCVCFFFFLIFNNNNNPFLFKLKLLIVSFMAGIPFKCQLSEKDVG